MDELELNGMIASQEGSKPRQILISHKEAGSVIDSLNNSI